MMSTELAPPPTVSYSSHSGSGEHGMYQLSSPSTLKPRPTDENPLKLSRMSSPELLDHSIPMRFRPPVTEPMEPMEPALLPHIHGVMTLRTNVLKPLLAGNWASTVCWSISLLLCRMARLLMGDLRGSILEPGHLSHASSISSNPAAGAESKGLCLTPSLSKNATVSCAISF